MKMDILRSYKILELDQRASLDEVRESYIDMARVWHPDGFTDNPRLRKKAEEKLKEINIAYAEIRTLLSGGQRPHRTKETVHRAQAAFKTTCKNALAAKEFARDFCSFACTILRKNNFKRMFRQVLCNSHSPGDVAHQKRQTHDGIPGKTGRMNENRDRHRKFADVYEEVAKAKKAGAKKTG